MNYTKRMLVIAFTFLVDFIDMTYGSCPERCQCQMYDRVLCSKLMSATDLIDMANRIPQDTKKLYLFDGIKNLSFDTLKNLKQLEFLSLNTIKMKQLPNNLSKYLPNVTQLHLPGNEIENLTMLEGYQNLEELKITMNKIKEIAPYTFQNMPDLKRLSLQWNKISNISEFAFYGLKNLRQLDLSRNKLHSIHPKAFYQLPNVEEITLHSNQLVNIPNNMFSRNKKLRKIVLNQNEINFIGEDAFANLTVRQINLRSNKMKVLPSKAFQSVRVEHKIYMTNNMFQCNCDLISRLQTHMRSLYYSDKLSLGNCITPRYERKEITNLRIDEFHCDVCDVNPCPKDFDCNVKNGTAFQYECKPINKPVSITDLEPDSLKSMPEKQAENRVALWIIISVVAAIVIVISGLIIWVLYQRRRRSTFHLSTDEFSYKKVGRLKNTSSIYLTMVTPTKTYDSDLPLYSP